MWTAPHDKVQGTDGFMPIDEFDKPWDKYIRPGAVIIDATGVTYACDSEKLPNCRRRFILSSGLLKRTTANFRYSILDGCQANT